MKQQKTKRNGIEVKRAAITIFCALDLALIKFVSDSWFFIPYLLGFFGIMYLAFNKEGLD